MTSRILVGDCRSILPTLEAGSVHCCVTSPPYFGLRDYGVTGQMGLEATPAEFIDGMVSVFREVRRVLRDDGTLWLNIGDSYNGGAGPSSKLSKRQSEARPMLSTGFGLQCKDLKPKDLMMIPARLALALQADGWWLRSDIIWAKPNPMPESVLDRPTSAHEHIFLLSKRARYFYDAEAVAEESATAERFHGAYSGSGNITQKRNGRTDVDNQTVTRNMRNVWTIATQAFSDAHFATFPTDLPMSCIKAGTSECGVCLTCGAPWARIVERSNASDPSFKGSRFDTGKTGERDGGNRTQSGGRFLKVASGWAPGCRCETGDPVPATVLDPFVGSGTTLMVADRLGRNGIGIELSPEYAEMARKRITNDSPMFAEVSVA